MRLSPSAVPVLPVESGGLRLRVMRPGIVTPSDSHAWSVFFARSSSSRASPYSAHLPREDKDVPQQHTTHQDKHGCGNGPDTAKVKLPSRHRSDRVLESGC